MEIGLFTVGWSTGLLSGRKATRPKLKDVPGNQIKTDPFRAPWSPRIVAPEPEDFLTLEACRCP
jgi:hypothetical protein